MIGQRRKIEDDQVRIEGHSRVEELPFISMPDPYSLPPATAVGSSAPARSRLGFLPGLLRYLAAASLLQLGFLAVVRVALFFQFRDFWILGLFGLTSPVLSLVLASVFFRRFTNTRWAIASILATTSACAYLLVRFAYAYLAWQYYSALIEPVLRQQHYVDLTTGGKLPASFLSCQPLDTLVGDSLQTKGVSGAPDGHSTSLHDLMRNISQQLRINCTVNLEDAIRASARFNNMDLGSKSGAELLICGGTVATLTIPRNTTVFLDSHRVLIHGVNPTNGRHSFDEYRGDTCVGYLPDSTVSHIRHKRDSLRQWREDSTRAASGK